MRAVANKAEQGGCLFDYLETMSGIETDIPLKKNQIVDYLNYVFEKRFAAGFYNDDFKRNGLHDYYDSLLGEGYSKRFLVQFFNAAERRGSAVGARFICFGQEESFSTQENVDLIKAAEAALYIRFGFAKRKKALRQSARGLAARWELIREFYLK